MTEQQGYEKSLDEKVAEALGFNLRNRLLQHFAGFEREGGQMNTTDKHTITALQETLRNLLDEERQMLGELAPVVTRIKEVKDKIAGLKSPFKVGEIVLCGKYEYQITRITDHWSYGRKVLKDGSLHKKEHFLFGELRKADEKS